MQSPVVSAAEMRAAEAAAFARGVTAESLMDEAAAGLARTVSQFFPEPGRCLVFAGKGNNAGDACAAAQLLHGAGWAIEIRLAYPEAELGGLAQGKLARLRAALPGKAGKNLSTTRARTRPFVILDGLLGLGATLPLREPIRSACRAVNELRRDENAFVFSIDLPTGLDGESGEADEDCTVADFTVAIGFAKRGLIADRALNLVGRLEVVALSALRKHEEEAGSQEVLATAASLRHLLPRRPFGAYKNQFGRVGIVAGSRGFTGAAVLCTLGALRGGAGLVELFVPEEIYGIVAASVPPEAMVKPVKSYGSLLHENIDVWALGPGLGRAGATDVLELIGQARRPMVIDADGLNILSADMSVLAKNPGPRLLTPHPGEMQRLFPDQKGSRAEMATKFCEKHAVTLLLKGSRTIVAQRGFPISYNTTGNPGMATGGMGDVLTGVCAALLAQKSSPNTAARLGAWVCGRAAEIAIFHGAGSEESLLPSDIIQHLGLAFDDLRNVPT